MDKKALNRYIKELEKIPTASLSDALDKKGVKGYLSYEVKPIFPTKRIVGQAVTIKDVLTKEVVTPLPALEVIDKAKPGDIIVRAVEDGNAKDIALWGGLMSLAAKKKGIKGAVLDGGVRDILEAKAISFSIFAKSITPVTSVGRTKVVEINSSITIDGVNINPGDLIVGDNDGVVVIPINLVEDVIALAKEIDSLEKQESRELEKGKSIVEVIKKYARV
ncbi:MAG: RraA family protein [Candidatus Bathyarchaeia archaeon]